MRPLPSLLLLCASYGVTAISYVVLHTAVAWQTVNELACGESGIVHGAECIAALNGVA